MKKTFFLTGITRHDPSEFNNAIYFLNPYFFRKFWAQHLKNLFNDEHLVEHSKLLFDKVELNKFYGLFMPVAHHSLLDPKIKLLGVFRPSLFHDEGVLHKFRNVFSLLDIYKLGRKLYLRKNSYNPEIDELTNEIHKNI